MKYLVEYGTNLNARDLYGTTLLMFALTYGHLEIAKWILARNPNFNVSINGDINFFYACHRGHLEIVKYLIENRADINVKNSNGNTALVEATSKGHLEIVKLLTSYF